MQDRPINLSAVEFEKFTDKVSNIMWQLITKNTATCQVFKYVGLFIKTFIFELHICVGLGVFHILLQKQHIATHCMQRQIEKSSYSLISQTLKRFAKCKTLHSSH